MSKKISNKVKRSLRESIVYNFSNYSFTLHVDRLAKTVYIHPVCCPFSTKDATEVIHSFDLRGCRHVVIFFESDF